MEESTRRCASCGEIKAADDFYPGRRVCRACVLVQARAIYAQRRLAYREPGPGEEKTCSRCQTTRSLGDFHRGTGPDGRTGVCRVCIEAARESKRRLPAAVARHRETNRAYYQATKERYAERRRRWLASRTDEQRVAMNRRYRLSRSRVAIAASRAWLHDFKARAGCRDCGQHDPDCLDFHHINPSEKTAGVGALVKRGNRQVLLDEIAKCAVLCANCHRKLHREARRQLAEASPRVVS